MRGELGCEAKTGHLVLRLGRPRRVWDLFDKVGDKGPPRWRSTTWNLGYRSLPRKHEAAKFKTLYPFSLSSAFLEFIPLVRSSGVLGAEFAARPPRFGFCRSTGIRPFVAFAGTRRRQEGRGSEREDDKARVCVTTPTPPIL